MDNRINTSSIIPPYLICPLTHKIFCNPVTASDNYVYEYQAIRKYLSEEDTSPITGELITDDLSTATEVIRLVSEYLLENPSRLLDQYVPSMKFEDNIVLIKQLVESGNYNNLLCYTHFDLRRFFSMMTDIEKFIKNEELVLIHVINNTENLEELILHEWRLIHLICPYSTRILEFIIKKGADINAMEEAGMTPLQIVTRHSNFESIKLLINYGANPVICSPDGWNAFHYACKICNLEIVKYYVDLLESNPEYKKYLNIPTVDGVHPIHLACNHSVPEVIKYLIDKKLDLNVVTNEGWTPLHLLCFYSSYEMIKYILDQNVDRSKKIRKLYDKDCKCGYLDLIGMNKKLTKVQIKELKLYKRTTHKKTKLFITPSSY